MADDKIDLRLDPKDKQKLEREAKKKGVSLSDVVRMLIRAWLESLPGREAKR